MIQFEQLRSILCIGAHPDDIEIGCGGTLLKLLAEHSSVDIHWVVLSGDHRRNEEAVRSANEFLKDAADIRVTIKNFRDALFPYEAERIKQFFHELGREINPSLIFTHRREDAHQDHRIASELTWCTFRNNLIMEYEIPKYEGDLGTPNVFFPLSRTICRSKVGMIVDAFQTQHEKAWFDEDTFWSLMTIRGLECKSPTKFAEAFYCRKLTF